MFEPSVLPHLVPGAATSAALSSLEALVVGAVWTGDDAAGLGCSGLVCAGLVSSETVTSGDSLATTVLGCGESVPELST
ncbi:hypothetical protein GCM10007359_09790 [Rothia aerolata]|uniref:Uncharacterized protein n=1 Tax=Rothia aerolata TaxID=1812262 RepID=A0A917MS94_9MICC|nr:hypothetical protein GCM10007359_09790 [Rothia aerolata]